MASLVTATAERPKATMIAIGEIIRLATRRKVTIKANATVEDGKIKALSSRGLCLGNRR